MSSTQSLTAARLAGFIWLLLSPFVWLGAALSKMDTTERYNIHLGLATVLVIVAIGAGIGALRGHGWARYVLLTLSWSAAGFWIYSGISISTGANIAALPISIGVGFVAMAAFPHLDARPGVASAAAQT